MPTEAANEVELRLLTFTELLVIGVGSSGWNTLPGHTKFWTKDLVFGFFYAREALGRGSATLMAV